MKRIQIVARIDPRLRKAVGRVGRQEHMTLNAVIEAALAQYVTAHAASARAKGI